MAGDREFARFLLIEAALASEDIMDGMARRMPVSYWTSGGCQSEGPRGLRPTLGSFGNFGLEIQTWESTSALMSKSDNQLVEI